MFADSFVSVLKTTVMFAGEFEPLNMSCDVLPYKFTDILVIYFPCGYCLLNLLIGLTVDNIDLEERN